MEDKEIKKILKQNLEVSQECLKVLKKMNRARIIGMFFVVLKWAIIVALSVGAYYYIEPYIISLMDGVRSITSGAEQVKQTGDVLMPNELGSASQDIISKLRGIFR